MKVKNLLSIVLCLALTLGLAVPTMAAPVTSNDTQNVVVSYGMGEEFLVNIPADFSIDTTTKKGQAIVSAENVMIDPDSVLTVTLSGTDYVDSWELVNSKDQNTTLTYTIGTTDGGNDVVNNTKVLTVNSGDAVNNEAEVVLYFTVIDELLKSGNYTDTLTFAVELSTIDNALAAGIYDANGVMLASWDELVAAGFDIEKDWTIEDEFNPKQPGRMVQGYRANTLVISDTVDTIGSYAFYAASINNLIIPSSVKTIKTGAFEMSSVTIDYLNLGKGVTTLEENAFDLLTKIKTLVISENSGLSVNNGFKFNVYVDTLIIEEGTHNVGNLFEGVENIPNIKALGEFSDTFTGFGQAMFYEPLNILEGTTVAYGSVFSNFDAEEIILPDSLKVIEAGAFNSCIHLKSLVIGENVERVDNGAFTSYIDYDPDMFPTEGPTIYYKGSEAQWEELTANGWDEIFGYYDIVYNYEG